MILWLKKGLHMLGKKIIIIIITWCDNVEFLTVFSVVHVKGFFFLRNKSKIMPEFYWIRCEGGPRRLQCYPFVFEMQPSILELKDPCSHKAACLVYLLMQYMKSSFYKSQIQFILNLELVQYDVVCAVLMWCLEFIQRSLYVTCNGF